MSLSEVLAIAHRGACAYAPENTRAAFDLALLQGATHMELDVRITADGKAAVLHDPSLERTTNGTGLAAERTLAELQTLDAGSWFHPKFVGERIPSYREVLERYAEQAHLHTEIKDAPAGFPSAVADLIREAGAESQTTVTSFSLPTLVEIRSHAPELRLGWLVHRPTDSIVATAQSAGFGLLCPRASHVGAAQVQHLHEQGFVVRVWGVKTEAEMRKAAEDGVDGMTVDFPDKLLQYLKEHG